jgi:hypothetical protein
MVDCLENREGLEMFGLAEMVQEADQGTCNRKLHVGCRCCWLGGGRFK